MKLSYKNIFTALLIAGASIGFQSCSETTEHNHSTEVSEAKFICPMDCEKGKTYSENVGCPVCGMDLKEVEQN